MLPGCQHMSQPHVPERREHVGSRPCPSSSPPRGPGEAQNWAEQGSPEDPMQCSGEPQTSPWWEAQCRAMQGSHSARAASGSMGATVTTDQRKTGKIPSPRSPPKSPAKWQPSWVAWCKGQANVIGEGPRCSTQDPLRPFPAPAPI